MSHNRRRRPLPGSWLLVPVLLGVGCQDIRQGRTAHDEWRDTCASVARAHLVAADQAARGAMTPSAFAALDDAFDELAIRCRNSLGGTDEQPAG